MALPKQRHTHHRRDRARKQYDVQPVRTVACSKCKASILPHRVCPKCGFYKGRETVKVALKSDKKQKKKKRTA